MMPMILSRAAAIGYITYMRHTHNNNHRITMRTKEKLAQHIPLDVSDFLEVRADVIGVGHQHGQASETRVKQHVISSHIVVLILNDVATCRSSRGRRKEEHR